MLNRNPTLDRFVLGSWCGNLLLAVWLRYRIKRPSFFECSYSAEVWKGITRKLLLFSPPLSWNTILLWLPIASSNGNVSLALLQSWQACLYEIWREQNRRFQDGITASPAQLASRINLILKNKCQALQQLGSTRENHLLQYWSTNYLT